MILTLPSRAAPSWRLIAQTSGGLEHRPLGTVRRAERAKSSYASEVRLKTKKRAFAFAAVRVFGARANAWCASIDHGLRRDLAEFSGELSRPDRLAHEGETLTASRPAGLELIHPSWYTLPIKVEDAGVARELDRLHFGHLVAMDVREDAIFDSSRESVTNVLERLGRRRVATAFSTSKREVVAQLCVRLGEPSASELLRELGLVSTSPPTHAQVRASQRSMSLVDVDRDPKSLLLLAGAAWIAPSLRARGGELLERTAQRLPFSIGALMLRLATDPPDPAAYQLAANL